MKNSESFGASGSTNVMGVATGTPIVLYVYLNKALRVGSCHVERNTLLVVDRPPALLTKVPMKDAALLFFWPDLQYVPLGFGSERSDVIHAT
jgi:hypothetical protein